MARANLAPLLVIALASCSRTSWLDPAGPVAASDRAAFGLTLSFMLFVLVPIYLVTPFFAWRYRRARRAAYAPAWEFSWPLEFLVWAGPIVIVAILGGAAWVSTSRLDPYAPIRALGPPVEVQVVMMDWKFLFLYPQQGVASTNLLVIPVGRDIHLSLTSATVMQSFLIPQLAGQIYAMPAMRTQLHLLADREGQFTGMNTQYNGAGFSQERFVTQAMAPARFDGWVAAARAHGAVLDGAGYAALARPSPEAAPVVYRSVPPGLFADIIARYSGPMGTMAR